jgi:TRAP-type C4-dicarboxylate transport system substrate-binding protein
MNAITLRNIPPEIQKAIRSKARQKRISANKAVIEMLQERVGMLEGRSKTVHHDLDELAGSWSASEATIFAKTVRQMRTLDRDLWR